MQKREQPPRFGRELRPRDLEPKAQRPQPRYDGTGTKARLETAAKKMFYGQKASD